MTGGRPTPINVAESRAQGSSATSSNLTSPPSTPDDTNNNKLLVAQASLVFCAGLPDAYCAEDGERRLQAYFEQWGQVRAVKIRGKKTTADRPYAFVTFQEPHGAAMALKARHTFKVKPGAEDKGGTAAESSSAGAAGSSSSAAGAGSSSSSPTSAADAQPASSAGQGGTSTAVWQGELDAAAFCAQLVQMLTEGTNGQIPLGQLLQHHQKTFGLKQQLRKPPNGLRALVQSFSEELELVPWADGPNPGEYVVRLATDSNEDRTIWVGTSSKRPHATEANLAAYFKQFGPLHPDKPPRIREAASGDGGAFAFVTFQHGTSARAALYAEHANYKVKPHKDSRWKAGWEARTTTTSAAHPQDELAALAARHSTSPPAVPAAAPAAPAAAAAPPQIVAGAGASPALPAGSWASAAGAASSWDPTQLSEAEIAAQQAALDQFSAGRPGEPSLAANGGSSSSSPIAEAATSTKPSPPPLPEAAQTTAAQTAAPPPADEAAKAAAVKIITIKQIRAVRHLLQKRRASVSIPIGSGSILEYVMQAMPELDRAKVVAAAFGGKAPCKVYRWTELDLAVIMMNLGYFTKPSD